MISWLSSILGILLVDLALSGDNAVVIGAAASGLPHQQRTVALVIGGVGAIGARIILALAATNLLQLPFIGVIGGIILLSIAIRLLIERSTEWRRSTRKELSPTIMPRSNQTKTQTEHPQTQMDGPTQKRSVHKAMLISITTILLADVTMSLDNVLAIGGLAGGNIEPLIIGLLFSMIFLLVGSAIISKLIAYLPWLLDLACLIVAWTAAQIFLGDDSLTVFFTNFPWSSYALPIIAVIMVLITDIFLHMQDRRYPLHP